MHVVVSCSVIVFPSSLHLELDVCMITCLRVTLGKMQSSVAAVNLQCGCAGLPELAKSRFCL